jgi:transposase-like protein
LEDLGPALKAPLESPLEADVRAPAGAPDRKPVSWLVCRSVGGGCWDPTRHAPAPSQMLPFSPRQSRARDDRHLSNGPAGGPQPQPNVRRESARIGRLLGSAMRSDRQSARMRTSPANSRHETMHPVDHSHFRGPAADGNLAADANAAELFARVRSVRTTHTAGACPHCRAAKGIQRWGTFSGRQRYRCTPCGRTFSDLTGTLLARSKRPAAWMAFIHEFHEARPLRETAHRIGVHRDTVFRWRHAILNLLRTRDLEPWTRPPVQGPRPPSAFLELRVPHSRKGQRSGGTPARPARSHSIPHGQRHRHQRISVILLDFNDAPDGYPGTGAGPTSRPGRPPHDPSRPDVRSPLALVSPKCTRTRLSPSELASVLAPFAFPQSRVLAERQENRRLKEAAELLDGGLASESRRPGARRPAFQVGRVPAGWIRGMRSFWSRSLRWLIRFRGVASRYLVHYLHWFRALERMIPFEEEALRPGAPVHVAT